MTPADITTRAACRTAEIISSGRTRHGRDTDFAHHIKCQIDDDGTDVHVYTFDVDVKDVQIIKRRIEAQGGGHSGLCATLQVQ